MAHEFILQIPSQPAQVEVHQPARFGNLRADKQGCHQCHPEAFFLLDVELGVEALLLVGDELRNGLVVDCQQLAVPRPRVTVVLPDVVEHLAGDRVGVALVVQLDFKHPVATGVGAVDGIVNVADHGFVRGRDNQGIPRPRGAEPRSARHAGFLLALRDRKHHLHKLLHVGVGTQLIPVSGQVVNDAHLVGDSVGSVVQRVDPVHGVTPHRLCQLQDGGLACPRLRGHQAQEDA